MPAFDHDRSWRASCHVFPKLAILPDSGWI
jgi:hypothetical protein